MSDPALRVVAAAIRTPDGLVHALPAPARHAEVLQRVMAVSGYATLAYGVREQGFLTSAGAFVNRVEAGRIARDAGQTVDPGWPSERAPELYSEDVW